MTHFSSKTGATSAYFGAGSGHSVGGETEHGSGVWPPSRPVESPVLDVSIAASPNIAANGRVIGIAKTIRDISDRKAAERQLQEFNARLEGEVTDRTAQLEGARRDLQTILDAMPSMVGYWDRNGINRFANRAYERWFGVDAGSLKGRHIRELLGPAVETVIVKHAVGRFAARSVAPTVACRLIREGTTIALGRSHAPFRIETPIRLEVDFALTQMADMAELVPGSTRIGGRTLEFVHQDYREVFRAWRALYNLASVG